jgi:hypothetical protein
LLPLLGVVIALLAPVTGGRADAARDRERFAAT